MCDCDVPDPVFHSDEYENVCRRCGVVMEQILYDNGCFNDDDHVGQAGAALGTVMATTSLPKRILAHTEDRVVAREKDLDALVDGVCRSLAIRVPSVINHTAKHMFHIHMTSNSPAGESKHAVAAACVYYACRVERASRELRFISSVCKIDMRAINAAAKSVKDSLRDGTYAPHIVDHDGGMEALVDVFLDRLHLHPPDRKTLWRETNKKLRSMGGIFDTGRKPRTIVGGTIFITAMQLGLNIPKKHILEAAGVCAQTLDKIAVIINAET